MSAAPWVIVAAGLHFRGGMDKANAELAAYLLNQGTAVHIVAHDVDGLFLSDRRATVHVVPRPAGSVALGEFGLDRRGRVVARTLESQLYGVSAGDLGIPAAAAILLLAITALAAWLPARRVLTLDPARALRVD